MTGLLIVSTFAGLIVLALWLLSLRSVLDVTFLRHSAPPGVVTENLDLALEAELIADAVERYANQETPNKPLKQRVKEH